VNTIFLIRNILLQESELIMNSQEKETSIYINIIYCLESKVQLIWCAENILYLIIDRVVEGTKSRNKNSSYE
jgi:hypothetical protein